MLDLSLAQTIVSGSGSADDELPMFLQQLQLRCISQLAVLLKKFVLLDVVRFADVFPGLMKTCVVFCF